MSREPIRIHRSFQTKAMRPLLLWDISRRFHRLSPRYGQVAHALRTLPPVAARVLLPRAAPRLACVKPAASVHPEPGSNSSLYIFYLYSSSTILTSFLKRNLRSNVFRVALYISYFLSSMLLVSIIISINCRSVTSPWRLPKRAANIGQNFYCTKTYFKYFLDYLLCD